MIFLVKKNKQVLSRQKVGKNRHTKEPTIEIQLVGSFSGASGGTRTRTGIAAQGILSPSCLPFHHQGVPVTKRFANIVSFFERAPKD